jgi:hypothetical protein
MVGWVSFFWQAALRRVGLTAATKRGDRTGRVGGSEPEDLQRLIKQYREDHPPPWELPLGSSDRGTSPEGRSSGGIAVAVIDGKPVFGVDSRHPTYTSTDLAAAERMKAILSAKYPDVVKGGDNIGQRADDELSHAPYARRREAGPPVKKTAYFPSCPDEGWPKPQDIEHYFIPPLGEHWRFDIGEDGASFTIEGLDGTGHLPHLDQGRSSITLYLQVHAVFGMLLQWSKWDGRRRESQTYVSRGDLARLGQFVWDSHGSLHPVALFIPCEMAWQAIKEFLEADGALATSIEWLGNGDLPPDTYVEPPAPRFDWKKVTSFGGVITKGWREPQEIERYFLATSEKRWFFDTGTDEAYFEVHGVDGTDQFPPGEGRIDVKLTLWGHPTLGVLFNWAKWGGGFDDIYASKGDLPRLHECAERVHGGTLPAGLFVSYEAAWKALNEFFETDGALPKSIEWIAERDLPPEFRRKHKRSG